MPTSVQNHPMQLGPAGRMDLRDMLLSAGVGQFVVLNAIQFMNFLPGTCEPYAQGVQEIVKGMQRLLVSRGAKIGVDGWMGTKTVKALEVFAGPLWYEKSWSQLYLDIMSGRPWTGFKRTSTGRYGFDIEKDTAYGPEEGMGSYMHGLGADASPMSAWTLRDGIAIPLTPVELLAFVDLQRRINAILALLKKPLINVDGRIGSSTISALRSIILQYGGTFSTLASLATLTPTFVATNAAGVQGDLEGIMEKTGATYVPDPVTSKPSVATASGTVVNPPDGMSDTTKLVIGAVAVGAVIALTGKKSRKRRK